MTRLLCLLIALAPAAALAQPADASAFLLPALPSTGTVIVETNLPDGMLYDGEALLGPVTPAGFELAPGAHRLVLREATAASWQPRSAEAEVEVRAGETTRVRLDVPLRYRVESFPFGAAVVLEQEDGTTERLGETPLDLFADEPLGGTLVVRKTGYTEVRQVPGDALDNTYSVVLRPITLAEAGAGEVTLAESRRPNYWIDAAALGLALGAGALAAHFKFKGDREFDEYARSGDPALREDFERFDTYSAVALGAMQVGIGVFAIRLVLR
ncbi:MAG: hypothetical protein AAGI91_05030 [Bacteroidota bacterium]